MVKHSGLHFLEFDSTNWTLYTVQWCWQVSKVGPRGECGECGAKTRRPSLPLFTAGKFFLQTLPAMVPLVLCVNPLLLETTQKNTSQCLGSWEILFGQLQKYDLFILVTIYSMTIPQYLLCKILPVKEGFQYTDNSCKLKTGVKE